MKTSRMDVTDVLPMKYIIAIGTVVYSKQRWFTVPWWIESAFEMKFSKIPMTTFMRLVLLINLELPSWSWQSRAKGHLYLSSAMQCIERDKMCNNGYCARTWGSSIWSRLSRWNQVERSAISEPDERSFLTIMQELLLWFSSGSTGYVEMSKLKALPE